LSPVLPYHQPRPPVGVARSPPAGRSDLLPCRTCFVPSPTMTAARSGTFSCDHGLRRQAIVQSLLSDVFQGRLRAGQHLVTQALAERFGVSHTPIREALITLAGIGIIDLLPNRGAIVRPVTA